MESSDLTHNAIILRSEAKTLAAYHKAQGDYAQDCYTTQMRIANSNPVHTSPDHKTKEDWLNSAAEWEKRRDHYRGREQYWRTIEQSVIQHYDIKEQETWAGVTVL